ncbi:hypothetical protein OPKNFCMD_5893 [Methylobacterium crusticola]|uniref:Carboxypeptidase regulatory-like domain-containing protein n=1 Tax=Methylobacterium crusticola TaxID=1697972 RepID=A0ABQ4R8S3_9HYPH|nr:hypothetical protein [Methylobacterium crusticola]GJD53122.1 hypothetical protein OPKNFCMD_5893 [Methylobacterium crusticola]
MRIPALSVLACLAVAGSARPALAGADIVAASIVMGRLYVLGWTERPSTRVTLDDRFETTSDASGIFQFELVHHPASCIVEARVEGGRYRAVVSNCGRFVCATDPDAAAAAGGVPASPAPATAPAPGEGAGRPTEASAPTPPGALAAADPSAEGPAAPPVARPIRNPPPPPRRPGDAELGLGPVAAVAAAAAAAVAPAAVAAVAPAAVAAAATGEAPDPEGGTTSLASEPAFIRHPPLPPRRPRGLAIPERAGE